MFTLLDAEDNGAEYDREFACAWTEADMQTSHEAWAHPGHSKFDSIITTYPELFPKDKKFRAAARHHRCPVCDLMKGARHYRKSRRMKTKAARDHARKHKQAARASILRPSAAPDPHAAARDGDRRNRFPVGSPHSSQIGSRIPLGILPSSVGSSIIGQRKATRPRG
mmetsp:Transcript_29766/g.61177  ORF Transcript_29766/g.61177 Transcript_29766/m.61177 type:complete len:167 (+) Transcript_29766:752-1252(+)